MKNSKHYKILIPILAFTFLASCEHEKKIDDKNAISVFADLNTIKADASLEKVKINIPAQIKNKSWFGNNNDNNQLVENFSFADKISKDESFWTGYRPGSNDRMVFSPIITDDKIYTLNSGGNLYAKNLSDYKTIWKKELVDGRLVKNFINGKISYLNGKIFASTGYNMIFSINAENGQIAWQKTIGSLAISAPISDGKQIFVITNDNKTYSLSAETGEINWVHSGILKATGILGSANPVSYKNYLVAAYSSGEVYLLDKKTGNPVWSYDLNLNKSNSSDFILSDVDATPVVSGDVVYAIGNGGLMMAIRISDGAMLWQNELASITDFWIAGDFIYLVNNDNQLICVYKKTGGIKWNAQLANYLNPKKSKGKIIYNGIIMAGGNLIVTNSNRELLVISPLDGKILQTKKLSQDIFHTPVLVNGKLYLHTIGSFTTNLVVME